MTLQIQTNPTNRVFNYKKYDIFQRDTEELTVDDFEWEENNIMNEQNVQPKMFSIAEVRELVAKAWEDGYTTSSEDSFHNKNTPYGKSDFFKEFYAKYNKD